MSSRSIKIIVEKHSDGYVAYPIGMKGVVVAEGDTFDDAVREAQSAIRAHVETFGLDAIEFPEPLEAFVAEATVIS